MIHASSSFFYLCDEVYCTPSGLVVSRWKQLHSFFPIRALRLAAVFRFCDATRFCRMLVTARFSFCSPQPQLKDRSVRAPSPLPTGHVTRFYDSPPSFGSQREPWRLVFLTREIFPLCLLRHWASLLMAFFSRLCWAPSSQQVYYVLCVLILEFVNPLVLFFSSMSDTSTPLESFQAVRGLFALSLYCAVFVFFLLSIGLSLKHFAPPYVCSEHPSCSGSLFRSSHVR